MQILPLPDPKKLLPASASVILGDIAPPHTPQNVAAAIRALLSVPLQTFYVSFLDNIVDGYELVADARPDDADECVPWDEALDTTFEEALGPDAGKFFGHGFTGEHCIDSRIDLLAERVAKAGFLARRTAEAWAEQDGLDLFLARFGIDADELGQAPAAATRTPDGQPALATLAQVLQCLRFANYDTVLDAIPEIEEMADSDDILAASAAMRTNFPQQSLEPNGAAMMIVRGVRKAAAEMGADFAEKLFNMAHTAAAVETYTPALDPTEIIAPAEPKKRGRKKGTAATTLPVVASPAAGEVPMAHTPATVSPAVPPPVGSAIVQALVALKTHGGSSERAIAEAIGIPRSVLNNMASGKTAPALTPAQVDGLRQFILAHAQGLASGLEALNHA